MDAGPPVIIVYGPTASGKSALAAAIAERLDGVVINADSLQVYRELEILTARPDAGTVARAPHRLYGVLSAATPGSAAWWREQALSEIDGAHAAGRRAIVTGGTGLYLTALMEGLSPVPAADPAARGRATALYDDIGGDAFRAHLAERDPKAAARLKSGDRQRLIRALEVWQSTGTALSDWQAMPRVPGHTLDFRLIGLMPPRETLHDRIERRFRAMLAAGALDEAARFDALGLPSTLPANKALGLPELRRHLAGEIDLTSAARLACEATRSYAKRQLTWFRNQHPYAAESARGHICHAEAMEHSERFLTEIMAFILRTG